MGFSPGFFDPGAKAHDQSRTLPGALKRSFPRINAGAPTKNFTYYTALLELCPFKDRPTRKPL